MSSAFPDNIKQFYVQFTCLLTLKEKNCTYCLSLISQLLNFGWSIDLIVLYYFSYDD